MRFFGASDWNDFLQDAEVKVFTMEHEGRISFPTAEDRKRYVWSIARNLSIDYTRTESNRKRILIEKINWSENCGRSEEILEAHQKVAAILDIVRASQPRRVESQKLTAKVIGRTMAAKLLEWEMDELSHSEIACLVFNVKASTPAQARKISRAMGIAKEFFKQVC